MSTPSPETVLPPHLEQAPAPETAQAHPAERAQPKVYPLRPIHVAYTDEASGKARAIVSAASRLVAQDMGVSGDFRIVDGPSGLALVQE